MNIEAQLKDKEVEVKILSQTLQEVESEVSPSELYLN
jgi:hypothetical protein